MTEQSQKDMILTAVQEAEMILVGIGAEFAPALPALNVPEELRLYALQQYYRELPEEDETIRAYQKLRRLIGAKPYFAVTLNTDDLIFRGGFEEDLVVAPCGSINRMQCTEHIVDAEPVCREILEQMRISAENGGLHTGKMAGVPPLCPQCQKPLRFHLKSEEGYLEEGYLAQWQHYNRWLSCTLNRKLVLLELGVDFTYPQVIRWPFEKVAYFNQKAKMIRVHSRLPQVASELGARGIAAASAPVDFLNEL